MKTAKSLFATAVMTLVCVAAQAQVTPQAYASAGGHTQAFKDKIAELHDKLNTQTVGAVPAVSQKDLEESAAQQRRQQEQMNKDMQQNFGFNTADLGNMTEAEFQAKIAGGMQGSQAQVMADMNRQMAALASLGITEADFHRAMASAGGKVMSEEEWKVQQKADQKAQTDGEAMARANETLEAYMEQSQVAGRKIDEAEKSTYAKIKPLAEKYGPQIDEAQAKANRPEEVMRGTITKEELESWGRKADALRREYLSQVYQIWTEYINTAQGHLKFLMPYAAASDDAKAKMPSLTGNAATDQMMRMSNNAVSVAGQYLDITASEPRVGF